MKSTCERYGKQRKRPKRHAPTKARESLNNKGEINVAQLLAMTSELHPWRFELEFFSKSVTLWTPLKKSSLICTQN